MRILGPLFDDLNALKQIRVAAGADDSGLLFPNARGLAWNREDYANWKNRAFRRAAVAADVPKATPYGLRHTFVSMLINEGRSPVEVAGQAGHAPTMTLNIYAHVCDDLDPTARVPAEQRILQARGKVVPPEYPAVAPHPHLRLVTDDETPAVAGVSEKPMSGLEPLAST